MAESARSVIVSLTDLEFPSNGTEWATPLYAAGTLEPLLAHCFGYVGHV